MCIIVYKPAGAAFPSKKTLQTCFSRNDDGAGFMTAAGGKVIYKKGFMTFKKLWQNLQAARAEYGDGGAWVLHFRIGTQGGTRPDLCHPFALSDDFSEMRKLDGAADIAIAHNGILSLTSAGYYGAGVDYSDTMDFIKSYLFLIIRGRKFYKSKKTLQLIERLTKNNRLAIMDGAGHVTLTGAGWQQAGGVWYSNDSYKPTEKKAAVNAAASYNCGYYGRGIDDWEGVEDDDGEEVGWWRG